ncbi:hypothetical protein [Paeniglutamicibacter terrestris]|uniref:Sensor domain-containing protein n=1 Tax=Paeniglutamicibacter terrestris TaxID=2723403 RepID=A0ABX1G108_9MICC|nr:hypothetical protein [Paeniglutamicibacter terrestris]NKG19295.1 hypothetical protein [Paeniglutamicibacter terrestris]
MAARTKIGALRTISLGAALLLALSACSSGDTSLELPKGHTPVNTDAPASAPASAPAAASASASTPAAASTAANMSTAELAVASGISMAALLGFDQARVITGDELDALRKAPEDTLGGVAVLPTQCGEVIESLNWSPVQMGDEGARSDFLNTTVSATGSVEVAKISDRSVLDKHYATALAVLSECRAANMNQGTETGPFIAKKPQVSAAQADSAILWERGNTGQGMRQQALVLIKAKGDYVAMVSFIAQDGLEATEFSELAAQILNAALVQVN